MTLGHAQATESRNHGTKPFGVLKRVFRVSVFPWLGLLAGCQSAENPSRIITLAVLSSPNSLDPRIGSDETSQRVHQLVYDNLLALDDQLKVTGGLASSWEQTDPLTYLIHLRHGVRFHETKHTGISALLEAGYSIPEVCRISGNSMRTIAHYAHVNEKRVFEKWQSFEYGGRVARLQVYTAGIQQEAEKQAANRESELPIEHQGENAKQI